MLLVISVYSELSRREFGNSRGLRTIYNISDVNGADILTSGCFASRSFSIRRNLHSSGGTSWAPIIFRCFYCFYPSNGFSQFFPKILLFSKNLFEIFGTQFLIKIKKKVILIFGVTLPLSLKNGQMRTITAFCSFLRKYHFSRDGGKNRSFRFFIDKAGFIDYR